MEIIQNDKFSNYLIFEFNNQNQFNPGLPTQ